MTDTTETTDTQDAPSNLVPATQRSALDRPDVNLIDHSPFNSMHAFGVANRMASMLASSSIVPNDYRQWVQDQNDKWIENPAAVGNCFIAIELANRLNTSPILIMQQVDMIHGRPALRGVLLIGLVNASRQFSPLMFESRGEPGGKDPSYGYRAVATNLATGDRCEGPWIDWEMVNVEGWPNKKGSKWKTMPEQMFRYRAAAFWSRIFAPHITLGLYEAEEARDSIEEIPVLTRADRLNVQLAAQETAPTGEQEGVARDKTPEEVAEISKPRGTRRKVKVAAEPEPKAEPEAAGPDDGTRPEPGDAPDAPDELEQRLQQHEAERAASKTTEPAAPLFDVE